jgi:thiamine-phosphate pyrophosphorylase
MDIDFRLYLISDRRAVPSGTLIARLVEAAGAGVGAIQLREKDLPPVYLNKILALLIESTRGLGARIFINGNLQFAVQHHCSLHLPSAQISELSAARALLGGDALIGVSTHSVEQAVAAEAGGASFLTFGPVCDTPAKRMYGTPQGFQKLEEVCQTVGIPVFAIGGITVDRARECREAGAHGVACIRALLSADDVGDAVGRFGSAVAYE